MKTKIFIGALAAIMLTACSNDDLTSVNHDGNEIAFNVVTNLSTRASDVYCNNNLPGSFKVWATYGGSTYITGDDIVMQNNKWINTSGTRYWPETGNVTFFAHTNAGEAFKWNNGAPTIEDFTVGTDVAAQKDLIYAVKTQGKTAAGQVTFNFRHALSQVVFQAKNTNKNLYVEIDEVTICKLGEKNTFTYPSQDTDNNIVNHTGTTGSITYNSSWGTWGELTDSSTNYSVSFAKVAVKGDSTVKSLTSANETDKEYSSKAMLLLPQTRTAWDINTQKDGEGETKLSVKPAEQTGTYFLVKCRIYNVANASIGYQSTDVCLWGGSDGATKNAAIPVSINWEQGKKYIYTFVFGDGNGGYDPEPEPGPNPEPVLVPITFNVTVDDFVPVTSEDIKMDKPTTEASTTD